MKQILQPAHWARPGVFAHGVAAMGAQVFVAGMSGRDAQGRLQSDDLVAQVRQALANAVEVLAECGARPEHITRMTWYLTDKREYLGRAREIGTALRELIGDVGIAMTAVQVAALMEDRAQVEIEVTAVVGQDPNQV